MRRSTITGLLCVTSSIAIVTWLILRMDFGQVARVLGNAQWAWLLGALAATCCVPLCTTLRWRGVLRSTENLQLPYFSALRAVLMANVLNSFLPSHGGDGAKALYLRKHGGVVMGVGTVILERAVDFTILGLLGVVGYFNSGAIWGLYVGALLVIGMAAVFSIALLFPCHVLKALPRMRHMLESVQTVFRRWVRSPASILQTLAGSILTWSLASLTVCFLSSAFQTGIPWGYTYSVFPLAILAGLVPITVSGVGTRDAAFVFLLAPHASLESVTLVGLGYTVFGYWLLSLISLPVVFYELRTYWSRGRLWSPDVPAPGVQP